MKRFLGVFVSILCALALFPIPAYAGTASTNKKAHAAYAKTVRKLKNEGFFPRYAYVDLTGDGVDEMVVSHWPSVYTYRKGKVVRVHAGEYGSTSYTKYYKSRKVLVHCQPDHAGSSELVYLKWNGKKFVAVARSYTPTKAGKSYGFSATYWVKGKGYVKKSTCKAYVKKLLKGAKAKTIHYR